MSTATSLPQSKEDQYLEIPASTIVGICERIHQSCNQAVKTGDYLSFATLLEFYIGDPGKFNNEDGLTILETLFTSLAEQPTLVYRMGWDLLDLLLRYVDRYFVSDVTSLPAQKPFRLVMALFSLICENGNPKELFVRACELLVSTETEKNRITLQEMSLKSEEEQEISNSKGVQLDMPADSFESLDDTKQENVKFCTIFEVMRYSLQHIETPHPAGYLLEAASTMLRAADNPNASLLSVTTYARRMYLLARDFTIPNEDIVDPKELVQVRKILVNFLTYSANILLSKYPLKFSERLFFQMKNRVAMAPPADRAFVYKESDYTRRISEVISRMSQLLLSYDYEPDVEIRNALGVACDNDGNLSACEPKASSSQVADWGTEETDYWSRDLLKGPSFGGLLILKTMLHFDSNRIKKPNWKTSAIFTRTIYSKVPMTAGLKDLVLYWALWISNQSESFTFDDDSLLNYYLDSILALICTSPSPQEKYVTGSIVARFLRFQTHSFSYNFCINIMKNSGSPYQHFVVVECLKMLITGKIGGGYGENKGSNDQSPSVELVHGPMLLNSAERREVAEVSQRAIARLFSETSKIPFYYLNFLSVVPTDPEVVLSICRNLESLMQNCGSRGAISECCRVQIGLLHNAVGVLKQKAQTALASTQQ